MIPYIHVINLEVLEYQLEYLPPYTDVRLVRVQCCGEYMWAIVQRGGYLSKEAIDGDVFVFAINGKEAIANGQGWGEYTWYSEIDALEFWSKSRPNILATAQEIQKFWAKEDNGNDKG
jgi:hypothetical protein